MTSLQVGESARFPLAASSRRSWLVVPASDRSAVEAAIASSPDVLVLDTFDFVKERDRELARAAIRKIAQSVTGCDVFVQVGPSTLDVDVRAAALPGVAGLVIVGPEDPSVIVSCGQLLTAIEKEQQRPGVARKRRYELVLALDTARANFLGYDLSSASERVTSLTLGMAELKMDLRAEPSGEIHMMIYLMQRIILVARATGRIPLGAWWRSPDRGLFANPDRTYRAALRGRQLGFTGAFCVMPDQVASLNHAFTPTQDEIGLATSIWRRFGELESTDSTLLLQTIETEAIGLHRARQYKALMDKGPIMGADVGP